MKIKKRTQNSETNIQMCTINYSHRLLCLQNEKTFIHNLFIKNISGSKPQKRGSITYYSSHFGLKQFHV